MPDVSGFGDYEEAVQHPRRLQNPCNVSVQMDLGMRGTVLDLEPGGSAPEARGIRGLAALG